MIYANASTLATTASAVVATLLLVIAAIAIALVVRTQRVKTTLEVQTQSIESLTTANEGLNRALDFERAERQREHVTCATQIGNLQGQISALSGDLGQIIAKSAVAAVLSALQETGALPSKKESTS